MKLLMINSNKYKLPVPSIPFGLCCVAAALQNADHDVSVLDLCFSKKPEHDVSEAVKKFQPDIIGISIRNIDTAAEYNNLFLLDQVKEDIVIPIKKIFTGPVIIGGPAVGIAGAEMLSFFDLEYAVCGDGETAMVEFVNRFKNKLPLNDLGGLIIRKNGNIIQENPPLRIADLNELPYPQQHHFIDLKPYRKLRTPIQIQTKRGCELKCAYCTYNTVEGHKYRFRDPRKIADEIEMIVNETGITHFEFSDSTFNIPLDHAKNVLRAINEKKLNLDLQIMGLNPGAVDEELISLMKESNFKEIQVGVESCCNRVLENLNKNFRKADILKAGEIIRKSGIPVMWHIMTGAPVETEDTLRETFDTILSIASKWDIIVVMNAIRAYKGSEITELMQKENPGCNQDNFLMPLFYSPKNISIEAMRVFNKRVAFKNPNVLFPDEVQRVPFILLKIATGTMRLLSPHRPWWQFNIFLNKLQKMMGITALKQLFYERRIRNGAEPQPS